MIAEIKLKNILRDIRKVTPDGNMDLKKKRRVPELVTTQVNI